ncbi:MAG: hypothetical protein JXM68_14645, partial [Sedimentisphaerales bacterium]|nr:hypothetical protein [Sedimentisphaerales bacterium]
GLMVPLLIMVFFLGVYPNPFIKKMTPAINKIVAHTRIEPVKTAKAAVPTVEDTAPHAVPTQSVNPHASQPVAAPASH